ncbi:MAG: hypothetical protein ACOY0R_15670 [Chloroflexota bacterium]
MFTRTKSWFLVLAAALLVAGALTLLSRPVHVSAAQAVDASVNSCLGCHEDLYYLHDTGCLYCLTDHSDRCVDCHEGDAAALKMEAAHIGLLAHPQENNGAKCLECHTPEEARLRLAEFASREGFDVVIRAEPYTPSAELSGEFPDLPQANPLGATWPWLAGGVVLFGVWLALVLLSPSRP